MTPPPDTDAPDPHGDDLDPDEAAVHAVLDGEATADERRRVARDPRLVARLAELRAVVDAMAVTPESPSPETFARLRATALDSVEGEAEAASDEDGREIAVAPTSESAPEGPGDRDEAPRPVIPLRTRTAPRRLPPLPAVAAVVLVLLALGAGLILADRGGDDAQTAADRPSAETSSDADDSSGGAQGGDSGEGSEASSTTAGEEDLREQFDDSDPAPQAGDAPNTATTFLDDDALRSVLEDIDPATLDGPADGGNSETSARAVDDEATRCSRVLEASDGDIAAATAALRVTVDGEELLVLSNPVAASEGTPATIRLTVVEPVGCVPQFAVQRDA